MRGLTCKRNAGNMSETPAIAIIKILQQADVQHASAQVRRGDRRQLHGRGALKEKCPSEIDTDLLRLIEF